MYNVYKLHSCDFRQMTPLMWLNSFLRLLLSIYCMPHFCLRAKFRVKSVPWSNHESHLAPISVTLQGNTIFRQGPYGSTKVWVTKTRSLHGPREKLGFKDPLERKIVLTIPQMEPVLPDSTPWPMPAAIQLHKPGPEKSHTGAAIHQRSWPQAFGLHMIWNLPNEFSRSNRIHSNFGDNRVNKSPETTG